jgi:hypothetical protein
VAGGSAEVFISGAVAGAVFGASGAFFSGLATSGVFFSGFVTAGASVFGATAGASVFGAAGALGFTSAGAFLSGRCFLLPGDSSGVGSWAITAPASAREQTISKLVIFFMLILSWS